jgi:hypothetical protein
VFLYITSGLKTVLTDKSDLATRRLAIVLTSLSFLIISVAIVILALTPVNMYELSIYRSTSPVFWIAIVFGMINGGFLLFRFYDSKNKMWAIGIFELVLCYILLSSIYLLRGSFFLGRADSLSYVGYSIDIIDQGFIPGYNFYPIFTILISSISEITGLPVIWITQLIPPFFLIIYTLSIFCWAKSLSNIHLFVASMMLASVPIFFAGFMPPLFYESCAVLVIPFFFYSLQKGASGDIRFRAITYVLLLFFVLAHQLVAIGILLFLVIIFLVERRVLQSSKLVSIPLVLFTFVILFAWIFIQPSLALGFINTFEQMIGIQGGGTTFGNAQGLASKVGILSTIQALLISTIDDIAFLVLSFLAGIALWKKAFRTNPISIYFFCLLGGSIMLLILVFFTLAHSSPFRLVNLNFTMILTIPLVGYFLYQQRDKGHRLKTGLIIVIIIISIFSSTASFYLDPIVLEANGTVTTSEISGNNWLISFQNEQNSTFVLLSHPYRFADMLYGTKYNAEHPNLFTGEMDPGDHFILPLSSNHTYDGDYLILTSYAEEGYTKVWSSYGRFDSNDFNAVENSMVISKIYNGLDATCYFCG